MPSGRKVITVNNGTDDAMSQTITNTGGGILVRIGSPGHNVVSSRKANGRIVSPEHKIPSSVVANDDIQAKDMSDARQRQLSKNATYRQSSTRQYIDDNNNQDGEDVGSGHMIYTKVASAKQQTGTPDSATKSFITRKITKGRLSEHYLQNGEDINHLTEEVAGVGASRSEESNRTTESIDTTDAANRKKLNYKEDGSLKSLPREACFWCRKTVYQKEKIGPIRDVLYHKQCFRCCVCGFVLNLTNFHHNSNDLEDKGLYCKSHEPVTETARVSLQDKTIQAVINKPKVEQLNPNIRGVPAESTLDKYHPTGRVNHESTKHQPPVNGEHHARVNVSPRYTEGGGSRVTNGTLNNSQSDSIPVGVRTALNAPKVAIYNSTVRPVPAMVKTAPPALYRNPSEYKARQVPSPDFTRTPTPPSPPQHVSFNGNTKTYYYVNRK